MSGVPGGVWGAGACADTAAKPRRTRQLMRAARAKGERLIPEFYRSRAVLPKQRRGDRAPLGVERSGRVRLAGAVIPVARIAVVAFLAVQVRVDPGAVLTVDVLGEAVCLLPV